MENEAQVSPIKYSHHGTRKWQSWDSNPGYLWSHACYHVQPRQAGTWFRLLKHREVMTSCTNFFFFFNVQLEFLVWKIEGLTQAVYASLLESWSSLLVLGVYHLQLHSVVSHVPLFSVFPINWSPISYSWHLVTFRFDFFPPVLGQASL